jgi:hypothetical protein
MRRPEMAATGMVMAAQRLVPGTMPGTMTQEQETKKRETLNRGASMQETINHVTGDK